MDAWGLIMSAMANLSLAVLLLIKERRRTPPETPPAPPNGQPCALHAGLVGWLEEIRNTGKETAREVAALRVDLARLEERLEGKGKK